MSEIIERAKVVVAKLGGVCCEQDIDGKLYLEILAILPLLIVETERLLAEVAPIKEELRLTDGLLQNSNRVLSAVPECPVHGACVPHAVGWIEKAKAQQIPALPEWRPLSVLEAIPPEKRTYYHMAIRREENRPELGMIEWQGPHGWVWVDDENGEIPSWATHCRFTDREGVPVPWAEVGL